MARITQGYDVASLLHFLCHAVPDIIHVALLLLSEASQFRLFGDLSLTMLSGRSDKKLTFSRKIEEGDLVIVYEGHDHMKAVRIQSGKNFQNRFGVFDFSDWIGKSFGSKVFSKKGGFVYLLAPTPELWTLVLSHRTQILYIADISFVISFLELSPGCIVMESGTGSGSLTTSLARAVAPTGHVYTFDFHELRASSAREDFEKNGLTDIITVQVRDIQGLGFPKDISTEVDAVFLDLPQPWLALPSVAQILRPDGVVCSFSPCIEQVQRSCEILKSNRFTDIRTFEILLRTYDVREKTLMKLGERDSTGCSPSVSDASNKRKRSDLDKDGISDQHSILGNGSLTEKAHTIVAKPYPETKGHTGYLTFARRFTN